MEMKKEILYLLLFTLTTTLFAQNYDETKAGSYVLPELLKAQNGKEIVSAEDWDRIRRPEILKLFEDNVYGQVPKDFDKIEFKVLEQNYKALNGKATYKQVAVDVIRNKKVITVQVHLFIPNKIKKPVPVFLTINHRGLDTMQASPENEFWPAEEIVNSGYAIAGFDVKDVAPDHKTDYVNQILTKLYPEQTLQPNGMRALGAWGWGVSRIIDYFETDKDIDASKVIVVGHSRGGKAALWCGAQDRRVAIAVSNESGNSGAKISRRNFGETVEVITRNFPHWFVPGYAAFANNEGNLPVDQHMLLALMAPRAVYVASAADDSWADPKGQYLALVAAQPVFSLFGLKTSLPANMPPNNEQVIQLPLGFHNRDGIH
ncbi:MAG TPA: acetylxylan esterase, partial [Porphyromonadaceae bacterium]|nr:acetylxylan esterase [Porphyromonadaceae bacterium]